MDRTLNYIFDETMRREGKRAALLYGGEEFNVFFRRNNDNQNTKDTMIMYYRADAPVYTGNLISFDRFSYLVLNKETAENDVYYKSAVIRCNGTINTHSLSAVGLPIFGATVNNAKAEQTTHYSLIDGNIEVQTQDCEESRALRIDDYFNEYGRTWRISNIYFIDGICHLMCEVSADSTPTYEYTLELSSLDSVNVIPHESARITATAYINGNRVDNATINYISSDIDVATIDDNGVIDYRRDGEVTFTAIWLEHNIRQSTPIVTVATAPVSAEYDIYVTPMDEVCFDFAETLTYYVTYGGVRRDEIPVSFKVEGDLTAAQLRKITITDNGDHTIDLEVSGTNMLDKRFDLVAYNTEYNVENRQTIKVTSLF